MTPDGEQSYRYVTKWARCTVCGFSQVYPMPSEAELNELYASGDYRRLTDGVVIDGKRMPFHPHDDDGTPWGRQRTNQEGHRIRNWFRYFIEADSFLDVGASTGRSVDIMSERVKVAHGVEPGAWGREWDAYETIEDTPLDKYDIVTCLHVLEHVPDPTDLLERLVRKTGKQLCLEVPIKHTRLWPHVGDFTEQSMDRWLRQLGHEPEMYPEGIYLRCVVRI